MGALLVSVVFCTDNFTRPGFPFQLCEKYCTLSKDETEEDKSQAYRDSIERSKVESRNGIAKRRYGLDLIMAYLEETGLREAALQILAMNVAHLLRFLLCLFWWVETWSKKVSQAFS